MMVVSEQRTQGDFLETLCDVAASARTPAGFVAALAEPLGRGPLAVERIFVGVQTNHPEFRARTYLWEAASARVRAVEWPHGLVHRPGYLDSPDHYVHTTGREYRVRDLDQAAQRACDVYADLHMRGFTDYLMVPLLFSDGSINTLAIATRRPGGFAPAPLAAFRRCAKFVTIALERLAALETVATVLDTYLGRSIRREIFQGKMRIGSGELIDGVIVFADLHDFTKHAARLAPDETVRLLNEYFDCLVEPIEAHGGHVLKFIGDSVLAFFPVVDGEAIGPGSIRAVRGVQQRLQALNEERAHRGEPELRHGVCLHYGRVVFGNVGSSRRLDFTIIGDDVNVAARCLEEDRHLRVGVLVTEAYVEATGVDHVTPIGEALLRGMSRSIRLYTLGVASATTLGEPERNGVRGWAAP